MSQISVRTAAFGVLDLGVKGFGLRWSFRVLFYWFEVLVLFSNVVVLALGFWGSVFGSHASANVS